MKVALIIPPYSISDYYPDYQSGSLFMDGNLVPGIVHPLGLMYISSTLSKNDINVEIFDGAFYNYKELINVIFEYDPDVIGIQVTSPTWNKVKKMAKKIKSIEDIPIIVGGKHLNYVGPEAIDETEHIDFAAIGDGEEIFLGLCEELSCDKKSFDTPGLVWKNENELVKNEPIPYFIDDLDTIPYPDRKNIDRDRYCPSIGFYKNKPVATMITSRGCNRGCKFCHSSEEPYRKRSVEDIITELKEIEYMDYKDVIIYDQDFGVDKNRAFEICDAIIEEDINLNFGCNLRIDSFDRKLAKRMKEAGFWRIFYGIESGSNKILKKLNKGVDKEMIENVVVKTDSIGIEVFGSFIIGAPYEDVEDVMKTIEFAKSLPLTFAKFVTYSPWPGSDVWNNNKDYGMLDKTPENMSMNKINFVPEKMDYEELDKLLRKAYREFYLRPEYILKRISQIETIHDVFQNIKGFLAFINA